MTNFTTDKDSDDYLSQETANAVAVGTTAATKKHFLVEVPDYESNTPKAYASGKSYMKMGNCDSTGMAAAWASGRAGSFSAASDGSDLLSTDVWSGSFVDDTRYRGTGSEVGGSFYAATAATNIATATPPNESQTRTASAYSSPSGTSTTADANAGANTAATAAIPTYVGWRDHTDGHRISTTRGDKIEVIGGNYRIVSLGRGTGVATYEMSGGIIVDSMEAPGNVTSVTWRECPTSSSSPKAHGWKWVEQTEYGNVTERYHGSMREEFFGDELISVVGSPAEQTIGGADGAWSNRVADGSDGTVSEVSRTDDDIARYNSGVFGDAGGSQTGGALFTAGVENKAWPTRWDRSGAGAADFKLSRPAIHEATWAASVTAYLEVRGDVHEEEKYFGNHYAHYWMNSVGSVFRETWHMFGSMGFQEQFYGAFSQLFIGASTTIGVANRMELFIGAEEQINLGGVLELQMPQHLKVGLNEAKVGLNDMDAKLKTTIVGLKWDNMELKETTMALQDDTLGLKVGTAALAANVTALQTKL